MNVHAHLTGRQVTSLTPLRALAATFPGWAAPDYADHFTEVPAGSVGRIVSVDSHGARPYTRFCIKFADGSRANGIDPARVTITD